MIEIPRIRIELEGVKSAVSSMLTHHNSEINDLITKSIESQINEEWFVEHINVTVKNMLENAVTDMSSNWELRQAISNLVSSTVAKMISDKEASQ